MQTVFFINGDVKQTDADGAVVYFYASAQVSRVSTLPLIPCRPQTYPGSSPSQVSRVSILALLTSPTLAY